jgi:predicted nuclease with RNAse H fold
MTVVGIDVGGERKGCHAVALRDGLFVATQKSTNPSTIVDWCIDHTACIVAVDAPCAWSQNGLSRRAERELKMNGQVIQCFKTPMRERAYSQGTGFYGWVFNGEKLYQRLKRHYVLFDGMRRDDLVVLETFPHAVVCALAKKVVPAKNKVAVRRKALRDHGYDISRLPNIDFVDAALCALTAEAFLEDRWQCFGDKQEGFIVVPNSSF